MKFYNREKELDFLKVIRNKSLKIAQMTVVTGRRRIGKTLLLRKSTQGEKSAYLFVAKKSETLLVEEFLQTINENFNIPIYGQIKSFSALFRMLMDWSIQEPFTLILDEFQEFYTVNPSVYSEMQAIWDEKKSVAKINLILCGSIYSLMNKIFESQKEPLFGRATARLQVRPFELDILKKILLDYQPNFEKKDLLSFYAFTGGVAKYVEQFVDSGALDQTSMISMILQENSLFIQEGKNVLIEEFGRDYSTYFSILSLIASSKTSRPEIESILEMSVGGFLDKLENQFGIIKKVRPLFSKPGSRKFKYRIEDNFLNFWFRFIYKNQSAIEIENFDYVKKIVDRDISSYLGPVLEKYFLQKLKESKAYSTIGSYWDGKSENEIDIIAINELEQTLFIAEAKLNREKYSEDLLRKKAKNILQKFKGYSVEFACLSLSDL
ncbi:MAG: putative ATPase (AAA+ superfamily) [Algoriphagus marincola HL-49]|uniref:Putative ATPase (AAA+ superfamily) n=1 Tax=Algoriphagus marincola HL-49 TaxID=1305737 RepID=A0A0P7XL86_9BACT|nr:MAG: putative ATPase (AAA+ superfamily) [Algoriphagus marincola HL-49]